MAAHYKQGHEHSRDGEGLCSGAAEAAGAATDGVGGAVPGRSGGRRSSRTAGGGGGGEAGPGTFSGAHQSPGRSGGPGRDGSSASGGVVAVCLHPRHRFGAGAGAALPRQCGVPLAVRRGDGEPSPAVGFSHRSRRGAGRAFHAGDRVAGGQGCGAGEPREPGRSAGPGQRRSGQFPARRAAGEAA